jgi:hypothetical protein
MIRTIESQRHFSLILCSHLTSARGAKNVRTSQTMGARKNQVFENTVLDIFHDDPLPVPVPPSPLVPAHSRDRVARRSRGAADARPPPRQIQHWIQSQIRSYCHCTGRSAASTSTGTGTASEPQCAKCHFSCAGIDHQCCECFAARVRRGTSKGMGMCA